MFTYSLVFLILQKVVLKTVRIKEIATNFQINPEIFPYFAETVVLHSALR